MRIYRARFLAGLLACAIGQATEAGTGAASLLIPYFEVSDVGGANCAETRNTTVRLFNSVITASLAKVTVWSDYGVAIINFPLYFHPFDQVSLDLGEMICDGNLPITGPTEPPGSVAFPGADFPNCDGLLPLPDNPVLTGNLLNRVQDGLTGQMVASLGQCAGRAFGDNIARGYLTVDLVAECNVLFPSDMGYDDLLVGDDLLSGTVTYTGLAGSYDFAVPAVAVKAGVFASGEHTFYGRYDGGNPSGADGRAPLPGRFQSPLVTGSAGTTTLIYWREGDGSANFFDCAMPPSNLPVLVGNVQMYGTSGTRAVTTIAPPLQAGIFPWAGIPRAPALGVADIDLSHGDIAYPDPDIMAQAWVITINDPVGGPLNVDPGTESNTIFRSGFEGQIVP